MADPLALDVAYAAAARHLPLTGEEAVLLAAEISVLRSSVAELERERDQARAFAEIHRSERDAEAAANTQLAAERDQALARVAELEREQARIDAAFEKASTIAEADHPDATRRAWELIAGALAGPGQPTQPATGGEP